MHLLGEIAVLLGVYKLRILAVGDYLTDVLTILVFVCKNRVVLIEFQHIDGSARWLESFNPNHTPHAGTLPSTDPRHNFCSTCPVLQSKKHFVCCQNVS